MKNLTFALILSICIHIILLSHYPLKKEEKESAQNKNKEPIITSHVRYVKLQPAKPVVEEEKKEEPKKPEEVKKTADFKTVEPIIKPQPKRELVKEAKQTAVKPKTVQEVAPTFTKALPQLTSKTPLEEAQEKQKKETLSQFLAQPEMELDRNMLDNITKSYLELYGEEYNTFNQVQKVFLQKNLRDIGRITQRYLRYPSLAVRLRQEGTNVVEFILYPNGDITNPTITNGSNSSSLDENTLETIRIAYKDYPRPQEPTKIKIYVNYSLY